MARTYNNEFRLSVVSNSLPSWVPSPGQRANISLNNLIDVFPCPQGGCSYSGVSNSYGLYAYCGGSFSPDAGLHGSLIHAGGGHEAYHGTEFYEFCFEDPVLRSLTPGGPLVNISRKWRRVTNPHPGFSGHDSQVNTFTGEVNTAPVGTPAASHTFQNFHPFPASFGGGPRGSGIMLLIGASGIHPTGKRGTFKADLSTGTWSMLATDATGFALQGDLQGVIFHAVDTLRSRYYRIVNAGERINTFNPSTNVWTTQGGIPNYPGVNGYQQGGYCPSLDLIICAISDINGNLAGIYGLDPANLGAGWIAQQHSGYQNRDCTPQAGCSWSPLLNAFGMYWGSVGTFKVSYLRAPAVRGGVWQFSRENFTGAAPVDVNLVQGHDGLYNRFRWVETLKCFFCYYMSNQPVQAFRPMGT